MAYQPSSTDIAVVGMACRFPDAKTPDQFWTNLRDGVESIRLLSDDELLEAGVSSETIAHPDYVKAAVVLDDVAMFDAGFFGFTPKDAAIMDPQHRHFLECSWEALENAGYSPDTFDGSIGVYAGCGMNAYFMFNILTNPKLVENNGLFLLRHTGNDKDFLSTRVSYCLNLRGPSVNTQTACSTSLVAIHSGCQSLLNGECDMVIAGGSTIELPHRRGYMYQDGEILSRDGHCRAFDHRSSGTIFGSGAGAVVLRRAKNAIEAGDTIHAIIRGSAINNDGSRKVGYLAPSVDGQAAAVSEALAVSGVEAESIGYIATHGTATAVGDPIEVAALTQAFRHGTDRKQFCAIGSVKTNIGHLDTAAGVASFIAAVQALKHKQIPPSLHFEKPNPLIDFDNSPFYVNAALSEWVSNGIPRRAGVSSLGVGGTNAHIILEEPPARIASGPSRLPMQVIPVSARSEEALKQATQNLAAHLRAHADTDLADVAFIASTCRKAFAHRRVIVARDVASAIAGLEEVNGIQAVAPDNSPSIIFQFPGGGAQYPNMAAELYRADDVYRAAFDECLQIAQPKISFDLKALIFPPAAEEGEAARKLEQPLASILAVFITEYALARMWMAWGVTPSALTGHSLGEYTSACIASMLTLEEALSLVVARGLIFEQMPKGGMLSIALPEVEVRALIGDRYDLSVVNTPELCVVSGEVADIAELEDQLKSREIECTRIRINVAAHSRMLDPFLEQFAAVAERIRMRAPQLPVISNLTGRWMDSETWEDPRYWVKHLRNCVRFSDGLTLVWSAPSRILLEVGPGSTLTSVARQHSERKAGHVPIASMRHPKETGSDVAFALAALGRVWVNNGPIDWQAFWSGQRRSRVPLPTYPFQHKRYWIQPGTLAVVDSSTESSTSEQPATATSKPLSRLDRIDDWFYAPQWQRMEAAGHALVERVPWLVFTRPGSLGDELIQQLRGSGNQVVRVYAGDGFLAESPDEYTVDSTDRANFDSLLQQLIDNGVVPRRVVHCLCTRPSSFEAGTRDYFYSLLYLAQAFADQDLMQRLELQVVTDTLFDAGGAAASNPMAALALGPLRVLPNEFPGLSSVLLDTVPGVTAEAIIRELAAKREQAVETFALRQDGLYRQQYGRIALDRAKPTLRQDANYVFTGGLGGVASELALQLARKYRCGLALLGRTAGVPDRSEWDTWLASNGLRHPVSRQILLARELESAGARVAIVKADITDSASVTAAFETIRQSLGPIHGIFHAAGTLDDQPALVKTRESADAVLAPKVLGVLNLTAAAASEPLEFLLSFSSTSAVLGLAGQVDYTCANAFLDAYSAALRAQGKPAFSVNWGVWTGAGMAARMVEPRSAPPVSTPLLHPLLQGIESRTATRVVYVAEWDESLWVIDEHRLADGTAFLPGTGYVELMVAAARHSGFPNFSGPIEIVDLSFEEPMSFCSGQKRTVHVTLQKSEDAWECVVSSTAEEASKREHARATVKPSAVTPLQLDWAALDELCRNRAVTFEPGQQNTRQERYLRFGPRWKVLRSMAFAEQNAVATLELAPEYSLDSKSVEVHPALLDLATGFALPLLNGYEHSDHLFVPLFYRSIRVLAPLPARIRSHARVRMDSAALSSGICAFDVTVTDEAGHVLVAVEDFAMRRIDNAASLKAGMPVRTERQSKRKGHGVADFFRLGIRADEGAEVLSRVLAASAGQVVASSIPFQNLLETARPPAARRSSGTEGVRNGSDSGDPLENELVHLWHELLGVDKVGLDDDFFDLGGYSLVAVRLFAKIKKAYKADLGLATLFEYRTIRRLAEAIRANAEVQETTFSSLVPMRTRGTRPPLFLVHGVGGNVLGYNDLVKYLHPDVPIYALQSVGITGREEPLTRMEEIAAHYISEIRKVQPHGPYYLGGYSFGGVAAYEMAQQLLAQGEEIAFLGMIDSDRPNHELTLLESIRLNAGHLMTLSGNERTRFVSRKIDILKRRFGGATKAAQSSQPQPIQRETLKAVRDANFKAHRSYYSKFYPGKVVLFRASQVGDSGPRVHDLGWRDFVGDIDLHWCPGNHIDIYYEPNARVLAGNINAALEQAWEAKGNSAMATTAR